MKIIAHGNNAFNADEFMKLVEQNRLIDGMFFDIAMTKDNKIIVFVPVPNNIISNESIEENTLEQLKTYHTYTLSETLSYFSNYKNKIILNILPLNNPLIKETNIFEISEKNNKYINEIIKTISNYQQNNLYLTSISRFLVELMKKRITNFKIGFTIKNDFNYVDTDFYIFTTPFLDINIMSQQLNNNKEIMLFLNSCEDLSVTCHYFSTNSHNVLKKKVCEELFFITDYPNILLAINNCPL